MGISDRMAIFAARLINEAIQRVSASGTVFEVFGCDETGPVGPAVLLVVRAEDVPALVDTLVGIHGDCEGAYESHDLCRPDVRREG